MTEIARPSFYEGQILRAADLDLGQEYARGTAARHERYLHTPGVASGLALAVDDSTGSVQVTLSAGTAIDATGRQIVVDRELQLAAEDLDSQGVLIPADTDSSVKQADRPWHPVFIGGLDKPATAAALSAGCGASAQSGSTLETVAISYGRPGEPTGDFGTEVTDGPESADAVRVLVGYVQWDGIGNFADAGAAPKGLPPIPPAPYAGVRADEVVARGGTLALRADQGGTRVKMPALVLDADNGGEMRFGLQDEQGTLVNTVFSVTAAGDLTLSGVIKSQSGNGGLWIESGTVTDGLLIPLPDGVDGEKVAQGQIALHIAVSPRRMADARPPGQTSGSWLKDTFECRVDGRRVFVRERWFDTSTMATAPLVLAGACDYVVVAAPVGAAS
jgi:hypothetical protein